MASPITQGAWTLQAGDKYHITGVDRAGKRFRFVLSDWNTARMYNIWRGTFWLVRGGRRYKIRSVYN